jgi:general secretion pathway protein D
VGISLDITPQINSKGYITLSINPKLTYLIDQYADFNNLTTPPNIKERSLMSVVKLKNGETLVLGGLISKDKYLKVNGVPVLKEIPLIKYLFSSKEKITTRKELVFVITPHIIYLDKKASLKDYGYKKLPSLEELNVK